MGAFKTEESMAKPLKEILVELEKNISKFYPGAKGEKFVKQVQGVKAAYERLEVQERHQETYDSLCKRGVELAKASNLKEHP